MILLAGFYRDADGVRLGEFLECLRRNLANSCIEEIHLFLEDEDDPGWLARAHPELLSPKLRLFAHGRRLKYLDLFNHANRHLAGRTVIIANSDIYFDHTLARLEDYDLKEKFLCLSRWDVGADESAHFFDHPASQDAWIFSPPIREFGCDFHLGVPGCDNRLAFLAAQSGLQVSNPSRSIRPHHLHASGVRRYDERQRIRGQVRAVPADFLGTRWIWFVAPCRGRLDDIKATIDSLIGQPRSSYVLVDYGCPDGCGAWVQANHPKARVARAAHRTRFDGAHARNVGAAVADADGLLCFLDADMAADPRLSVELLARYEEGAFLVPDRTDSGLSNALVCSRRDFDRAGGFDEVFLGHGEEVADLKASLSRLGLGERTFSASLLARRGHDAAPVPDLSGERERILAIHGAYRKAKTAALAKASGSTLPRASLMEIYSHIAQRHSDRSARFEDIPCAEVAFRENMGYTLARIQPGVSSHNNDWRPFSAIPDALAGRCCTQVVSCRVSAIEVEFLSPGRLYLLVGTDWDGYFTATAWLRESGQPEELPAARTAAGTAFEIWSLVRGRGERLVLPTQVMLVADRLTRR